MGSYYRNQHDYDNMLKYYTVAIDQGSSNAMYDLAEYYRRHHNHNDMIKYYLMTIVSPEKNKHTKNDALVALSHHLLRTNISQGIIILNDLHKKDIINIEIHLEKLLRKSKPALLNYLKHKRTIETKLCSYKSAIDNMNSYITELEFAPKRQESV
jgi:hypothetical protein